MSVRLGRPPRWVSFAGVAAIGFGVQIVTLAALISVARVPPALATALAVEAAILHNFAWHERWTWGDRAGGGAAAVAARLARFHAGPGLVSLVGNLAITVPLVEWTPLPVVAANSFAVLVLGVANYCIADRFVFDPPSRAGAGDMHVGRFEALPRMRVTAAGGPATGCQAGPRGAWCEEQVGRPGPLAPHGDGSSSDDPAPCRFIVKQTN